MWAIVNDLHARLSAALSVPVLRPEDAPTAQHAAPTDALGRPAVGRGERGLGAYLAAHPDGYVQLEDSQGITDDGLVAVFWVAVASIAATGEQAEANALAIRRVLCGTPYEPGPYLPRLPDGTSAITPGTAYLCRPTYEIRTVDGVLAV